MPQAAKKMEEAMKTMPKLDAEAWANSKFYRGGFDGKVQI
jgi:hypothetical protein